MLRANQQRFCVNNSIRVVGLICACAMVGACARDSSLVRDSYQLSYEAPVDAQASELENLSAKIYLIADNQRHELLGDGVAWFRNSFGDSRMSSGGAIRPPQLDLFGQDLLVEALGMVDGFVLHLGDASDISNTGEFGRFAFDMQRAPQGWVMAPGNHDGFFFGNSSRTRDRLIREWNMAAETYELDGIEIDSGAMQKDRFVSYYLAALILQDEVWSGPLARSLGPEPAQIYANWTNGERGPSDAERADTFLQYWAELVALQEAIYALAGTADGQIYRSFELPEESTPAGRPYLRRLAWHIDKDKVWRSFVLQELDISASAAGADADKVSILVLDSSQYGIQPSLDHGVASKLFSVLSFGIVDVQVAGLNGNVLDSQRAASDQFVRSMRNEGRRWIVASHHPFDELGRATAPRFNEIRDAGGIPLTLSAHTHIGEFRWNRDSRRETEWLEVNVGSILDSPVEFRDFQVHRLDDRVAVSTRRYLMEDELRKQGLIIDDVPGHRPSPGDSDFYLDYAGGLFGTASETDFAVKRILLAAYLRMLRLFEADDPDQYSTYWPTGPNGTRLMSHRDVVSAVEEMLEGLNSDDVERLTKFLYELREFDRTRALTAALSNEVRRYRLSQAIWAGHAELSTLDTDGAEIDPDISFLLLPSEPIMESRSFADE